MPSRRCWRTPSWTATWCTGRLLPQWYALLTMSCFGCMHSVSFAACCFFPSVVTRPLRCVLDVVVSWELMMGVQGVTWDVVGAGAAHGAGGGGPGL